MDTELVENLIGQQALTGIVVDKRTADEWAQVIRADLGVSVAGFVAAGKHLAQAKDELGWRRNGAGFEAWCKESIRISVSIADKLMALARNPAFENSEHVPSFPPSWGTLYELSRLDAPLLEAAVTEGRVHPELERKAAIAVVVDYQKAAAAERAKSVQLGQWWQLGDHLLYCGDSASSAFTSRASGAFAFADPPYNAGKADWDNDFRWRHDYLADVAALVAVTPGISAIPDFLRATEMPYRWSMAAWITNGMTRGALGFGNWIYLALFAETASINREMQDHMRISVSNAAPSTRHESRKPAELLVNLIEAFTEPGDTVIDPFLGSGTTLFAAEQSGRRCIGAEIEPEFCSEIITRYGPEAKPL
jgi:hypothetical protein